MGNQLKRSKYIFQIFFYVLTLQTMWNSDNYQNKTYFCKSVCNIYLACRKGVHQEGNPLKQLQINHSISTSSSVPPTTRFELCFSACYLNKLKSLKVAKWRINDQGWRMKKGFADRQTNRQTDIGNCRVTFAPENRFSQKVAKESFPHNWCTD